MCQHTGGSTGGGWSDRQGVVCLIRIETYNIWNGWNMGLEFALCRMSQARIKKERKIVSMKNLKESFVDFRNCRGTDQE